MGNSTTSISKTLLQYNLLLHPISTSKLNDLDLCSFFIFDMWSKDDDCRVFVIEISTF